jgi:alpha-N-arabinofuranosidase
MDGLSLHYYTIATGDWGKKGSATEFDETLWHATLRKTLFMDELVTEHGKIMDRFDPQKRIGMVVDEWGTWYDVEPGTNPGFLYQQNSLRDALVAALNFHIFHRHADRVSMANIAQTVNVLQAMVLTDGAKMLRTPTYHVFEMFKVHQGGTYLPAELETGDYVLDNQHMPAVSASATRDKDGTVHLSLVNCDPHQARPVQCQIVGAALKSVSGRILTAPEMNAHNTFEQPDAVQPVPFAGAELQGDALRVTLPPKSVVVLRFPS